MELYEHPRSRYGSTWHPETHTHIRTHLHRRNILSLQDNRSPPIKIRGGKQWDNVRSSMVTETELDGRQFTTATCGEITLVLIGMSPAPHNLLRKVKLQPMYSWKSDKLLLSLLKNWRGLTIWYHTLSISWKVEDFGTKIYTVCNHEISISNSDSTHVHKNISKSVLVNLPREHWWGGRTQTDDFILS